MFSCYKLFRGETAGKHLNGKTKQFWCEFRIGNFLADLFSCKILFWIYLKKYPKMLVGCCLLTRAGERFNKIAMFVSLAVGEQGAELIIPNLLNV